MKPGSVINTSNKVHVKELPVRVPELVGRNSDCIHLLNILKDYRLIWIEGVPGIGKSALAKEVAHLAYERDIFEDGILYMSVKDCQIFESLVEKVFFRTMEGLKDSSKQAELEKYLNVPISEKYNRCLGMIRNLKLLIILDNCDPIVASEQKHFKDFLEDVTQKLENARVMITSAAANDDFVSQGGYVYKVEKLSNKNVFDLLCKKVKSKSDLKQELYRIQKKGLNTDELQITSMELDLEHDFFRMLNGHPLSTLLVASLRNGKCTQTSYLILFNLDTSLVNIYRTLRKTKKEQGIKLDMSELIFTLNIETSMTYVKKQNKDAYMMLLYFALCPSGLTRQDCYKLAKDWGSCEQLLMDRTLIKIKQTFDIVTMGTEIISDSQSSNRSAKKARMYSMDLSLLKCIEAGMDDREKEEADVIIVKRIVSLLEKLLKDNYSNVS